jgi:hypothetical protein
MHVAPYGRVRIELIEEMVLTLPPDWAIGIVHPIVLWEEMVLRSQGIVSDGGKLIMR